MLRLALGALRRRVAQSLAVLAIGAVLVGVAAAGPLFDGAAAAVTTGADLAAAPARQRLLSVHRPAATGTDPAGALEEFRGAVEQLVPPAGAPPVLGLTGTLVARTDGIGRMVPVAYRAGACERMRIDGACPAAAGEAVPSRAAADTLGLRIGDRIELRAQPSGPAVTLTVTGTYERLDPGGTWWADPRFGPGHIAAGEETLDPVFVPLATFTGDVLGAPTAVYTVDVPRRLVDGDLEAAGYALRAAGFDYTAPPPELLDVVAADRAATRRGVLAGWVQALVVCWLALGIVGRHTAQDRRPDHALLKLRGATRRRMLRLTLLQHLLPMLAALPVGLLLALAAARFGAGGPAGQFAPAAVAAGVALAAGLAVLVLTEVPLLRAPVADLLRRVPGRPGRAAALFDVLLVALAGAALYQARSSVVAGVAVVAPVLLAMAVAVLAARSVTALAGSAGRSALRAGRLPVALAGLRYRRMPGIDRVFALVAVAVALLGLAVEGSLVGRDARAQRTAIELGAGEVLTVRAANQTALLSAVRQADPGGRTAMAVALDRAANPPVLAVDAARLGAVTGWRPPGLTAPAPDDLPTVDGTSLTLAGVNDSAGPLRLVLQLVPATGGPLVSVVIGPVPPGEHEATAPVPNCAPRPGCRIVGLALTGPSDVDGRPGPPPAEASLTVRALRQDGPAGTVLDARSLGDPRHWRPAESGAALLLAAREGTLTLRVPRLPDGDSSRPDNHVYVIDTALPVPAVLAGAPPPSWASGDPSVSMFGALPLPVRVAATAGIVPMLGTAAVVLDLDAVRRALPQVVDPGTLQVWIAPGTSEAATTALLARLGAAGVELLGTETAAQHEARLAEHGPAFAARFQLMTAGAGLLLAALTAAVAVSVERRVRSAELRAMRIQGLPAAVAAKAGAGGQAALLGLGVLGGLAAAVAVGWAVAAPVPVFIDDWQLLARPPAQRPAALAAVGLLALAVLAAVSAGALTVRTDRTGEGR